MSATTALKVRTGRSIWQGTPVPALHKVTLRRDTTTDVLVVGAGISGALVAEALTDAGLKVLIVDKGAPLSGATSASTALLQYEIDVPLCRLKGMIGRDRALRLWRRSRMALDALRERTERLGINARCQLRQSLYVEGNLLDADGLELEARERREAGFEVELLGAREVHRRFGIARRAGILTSGALSADPRRLAAGYLRQAIAGGARLCAPAEVISVEPGKQVQARLANGVVIRAHHLVFATGYEIAHGVPRKGHRIVSTWAIATRPQRALSLDCLVWEAANPYLYLRPGPGGRIICGGEDEAFQDPAHRDALLPQKTAALERQLTRLLPGVQARAEYAWAGSFGTSPSGAPSMGSVPGMPGCHAVLGYGGNGITFAMAAAQVLRASLTGGRDADADLFSFRRQWPGT